MFFFPNGTGVHTISIQLSLILPECRQNNDIRYSTLDRMYLENRFKTTRRSRQRERIRNRGIRNPSIKYTGFSFSAIISFQFCYKAGISFKAIIIAYYSFVFGHGLLFTFTIFPKDLPGSTQKNISNSESNEKHSSSSDYCSNGSETDTNGRLKNLKSENMSGEAKNNGFENIQIQENYHDGGTLSNKTSDEGIQFA